MWEYICPVVKEGPMNQGENPTLDERGHQYNAVFKIHRYPVDYPAFDGKDMTPGDPIEIYPTGVDDAEENIPEQFELNQNYPNPFNPKTVIGYRLPVSSHVQLKVFDLMGQEIKRLVNELQSAGRHKVIWNGTNNLGEKVSSGVYFYKLQSNGNLQIRKMTLLR